MSHKRNTEGLSKTAKQKHQNTMERVKQAIESLLDQNLPINFNSVSKAAQVGKPWLYKEASIYQKISTLRKNYIIVKQSSMPIETQKTSEKSKVQIILMLKERIRVIEDENKDLKRKIEILYGKLYPEN